jgi:hypothetical protein
VADYDDNLLNTSENLAAVDWDHLETGGIPAEGKHRVTITKVGGELKNFKTYTGPQAVLQMTITEGDDKGKMIFDRINLPHASEAQGNQNRRVLIASRLGLIQTGSKDTTKINWKLLEGMEAVVTVIHKKGTGDNAGKTYANLSFDGYENIDAAMVTSPGPGGAAGPEAYADI